MAAKIIAHQRLEHSLHGDRADAPVTLTHGGHFLQEEVPTEIADALMDVVGRLPDPPPDGDANRSGTARVASQAGGASTL